jgi:hypothetical protein
MGAFIHFSDAKQALGSCGNVFVTVLRQPMTMDVIEPLRREQRKMSQRCAGKCVTLAIIESTAMSHPSPQVREATASFAKEGGILGAAILLEGSGFRAAAIRTLVAGMYLVSKKSYLHRIVQTTDEGAAWLVELLAEAGVTQAAGEILATVDRTRAAIG